MQARIFALREFVTVGEAGFLALRDERVKFSLVPSCYSCNVKPDKRFECDK